MTATIYRPGDIATVDGQPAVYFGSGNDRGALWHYLATGYFTRLPREVGPVLGNVADIAKGTNEHVATAHSDCQRNANAAALDEVRAIHHEWGETEDEDIDQLLLWERIGYALTRTPGAEHLTATHEPSISTER